jgi:tetratricopeptide (TPR) repeat protein
VSSEQARDLRQQGIAAAKAGQKDQARQLLQQSIRLEPKSEAAWLWLASVARDQRERVFCLQKILEINPTNDQALKALAQVDQSASATGPLSPPAAGGGLVKRLTQTSETPAVAPVPPRVSTQEMMAQAPGVPLPDADKVRRAAEAAEAIVREELQTPASAVKWVRKTKGRAGERDIWVLRGYVAAGSLVAIALLCTASYFVVANTPPLAAVVFAPTATLTFTPTHTSTPTPGLTPTPSPTPRVAPPATATVPVSVPTADVYSLEATDVYPEILEAPLQSAISLIDRGEYSVALPTLAAERANTSTRFNPNPYYYEAVALARNGNFAAALRTLREAEDRLEEAPNDNFQPLIDTGFAYVYLLRAENAELQGSDGSADVAEAQTRAEAAAEGDPRLALAHVYLARSYALQGDERTALEALNAGQDVSDLQNDVNLIAEKARVYLQLGEYERADREAFLALYIDPTTAAAYEVQIMSALAQDDPGLAVLRAQAYLFYYPGNADAWRMLGDARTIEGNPDLAIDAYSQALEGEGNDAVALAALLGRGAAYEALGRYDAAYEDYTQALETVDRPDVRLHRMEAAYQTGQYAITLEDAEALAGTDVDAAQVAWIHGRALVEQAEADDDAAGSQAITLLQTARSIPDAAASGLVDEYIARAEYSNRNYSDALDAINAALTAEETVMRRYVRGLILQERRENDEASADYEWVLAWSSVYPFPFAEDAAARLEEVR